jgi:hypothetical protein
MRFIQSTLLVIGATAFGGVSGWFATNLVMSAMFEQPSLDAHGGETG